MKTLQQRHWYAPLWLMMITIVLSACGAEAPPRPNSARIEPLGTDTPLAAQPNTVPLLSDQVPNPRAQGDPNAPIVVIEYGDYQ
jgi:hypothetical protein